MDSFDIRSVESSDRGWIGRFVSEHWGASLVVVHGVTYYPERLPGFYALRGDERVGLATYSIDGEECELVTLDSLAPGAGSALVEVVKGAAQDNHCRRLWLVTTNDNTDALRFYQKRGFEIVAVHKGAVARSRKIKPEIPLIGNHGIPIRDEIELAILL